MSTYINPNAIREGSVDITKLSSNLQSTINNTSQNISTKVDKEDGKGLSTNDYTTAEKNKPPITI